MNRKSKNTAKNRWDCIGIFTCACMCVYVCVCVCVFVWVIVAYYCVCMCKWYILHVYVMLHAQRVVLNRMLGVNISRFCYSIVAKGSLSIPVCVNDDN